MVSKIDLSVTLACSKFFLAFFSHRFCHFVKLDVQNKLMFFFSPLVVATYNRGSTCLVNDVLYFLDRSFMG